MRAVLISIQPKWCEKIASGEKTIEIRKTRPKFQTPFKCYIYATWNGSKKEILVKQDGLLYCEDWRKASALQRASGKVIGEFVCDMVEDLHEWELSPSKRFYEEEKARIDLFLKESCLTYEEICVYMKNLPSIKPLYGWHIADLKIYDKPKELGEFTPICRVRKDLCKVCCFYEEAFGGCCRVLSRPPQSWCYVEDLESVSR